MGLFGLFKNKAEEKTEEKPIGIFALKFESDFATTMFLIEDENGNRLWRGRGSQIAWFDVFTQQTDVNIYMLRGEEKTFLSGETVSVMQASDYDRDSEILFGGILERTNYTYRAETEKYWDEEEEEYKTRIVNWYIQKSIY